MSKIKLVSRAPLSRDSIPALSFVAETPHLRYKLCLSEQRSLIGKVACFRTYMQEKSDAQ